MTYTWEARPSSFVNTYFPRRAATRQEPELIKGDFDPYWYYANPQWLTVWNAKRFDGVTKDSVSCKHCKYVPRSAVTDPRTCFRAHMKKQHPREYALDYRPQFIIREEPDYIFT